MTSNIKKSFMEDRHQHDSLSQAIKISKAVGLSDKQIKPLVLLKQELKEKCHKNSIELAKKMSLSENITHLTGSWYAVRYCDEKGNVLVRHECLKASDVHLLKRNGRYEKELNKPDLDTLLPGLLNEEELILYKESIREKGYELIATYIGDVANLSISEDSKEEVDSVDLDKPMAVSVHAGTRWVQRIEKHSSNDRMAEEYYRIHDSKINEDILNSFGNATQVWKSDRDGATYWFDSSNNAMFVVRSNTVITLYEEDFGFTKDMNTMIVHEQLKVLDKSHKDLLHIEKTSKEKCNAIDMDLSHIEDEIAVLEAKIEVLVSNKSALNSNRDHLVKQTRLAKAKYDSEFNKLFKKFAD